MTTAPRGVSGPFNVFVVDGYTIQAEWTEPSIRTGLITEYILRAYDREDLDETPVEASFTNTTFTRTGVLSLFVCKVEQTINQCL